VSICAAVDFVIGLQAMPEPPFQTDMRSQNLPPQTLRAGTGSINVQGSPTVLLVTRPEEIPAALAQGKPVLIDIPAFQWRASLLATVQGAGKLGWWIFKLLATLLLTQWLNAQFPNTKDYLIPDWAKFNFQRQPDNKIILSPHEE
jgi:hypothetical protein